MENIHAMDTPHHVCTCGKYEPKTTKGFINTDCKKCNGIEPVIIFGPDSCINKNESF